MTSAKMNIQEQNKAFMAICIRSFLEKKTEEIFLLKAIANHHMLLWFSFDKVEKEFIERGYEPFKELIDISSGEFNPDDLTVF